MYIMKSLHEATSIEPSIKEMQALYRQSTEPWACAARAVNHSLLHDHEREESESDAPDQREHNERSDS